MIIQTSTDGFMPSQLSIKRKTGSGFDRIDLVALDSDIFICNVIDTRSL